MQLLAHITETEFPLGVVLFLIGLAVGFALAFAIWGPGWRNK